MSGLKEQVAEGVRGRSRDGMTAAEQLKEIRERVPLLIADQLRCLHEDILPKLAELKIRIVERDAATWPTRSRIFSMRSLLPTILGKL